MDIKLMHLEQITPYANNPRDNDNAVESVAKSIQSFGFNQPIVVDKKHVIVVGHTRYRAAQLIGMEEVPVFVADTLSEKQANEYRIVDNKVGEFATWDWGLLPDEIELAGDEFTGFALKQMADEAKEAIEQLSSETKKELKKIKIRSFNHEELKQVLNEIGELDYAIEIRLDDQS